MEPHSPNHSHTTLVVEPDSEREYRDDKELLPTNRNTPSDYSFEFVRSLANTFATYWPLHGFLSITSGLLSWLKATYSFMSFTGIAYCPLEEEDNGYYLYGYVGLLAVCILLTAPSTMYEYFRKARKYPHYVGKGTKATPFKESPSWLKTFNSSLSVFSIMASGWNIGSMLGRPAPTANAGWDCFKEGWNLNIETGIYGAAGTSLSFALGGGQAYAFIGKKKAPLGNIATAGANAVYKLASTAYAIIQKAIRTAGYFSTQTFYIIVAASLFYIIGSLFFYRRSNIVNEIYVNTTDEYKISALKQKIQDLKKKLATLKNDKTTRPEAIEATIKRLNNELDTENKQGLIFKFNTHQREVKRIFTTETYKRFEPKHQVTYGEKLWRFCLVMTESAAGAILAYHSVVAIFEHLRINNLPYANKLCETLAYVLTVGNTCTRFFRYIMAHCNTKPDPEISDDKALTVLKTNTMANSKVVLDEIETELNNLSQSHSTDSLA